MDPVVQIREVSLKIRLVVRPRQPVHARGGITLEREERFPEQVDAEVVEERGEPFLLPVPCGCPYTVQRLGHAFPVLRPARALLSRVSLGPRPWLPRLRSRLPGLVRQVHSYYGGVWSFS
jgi:hypothetical protein